ncbi:Serine/threonine-protein kinase nrc-2 [Porphyridium purpureum]|uniref:non-specific serine/threonine protein kinase n=1 Tax=Porphyridium purpureum TaxID=35688 RepID=A0A5J4YMB9_PORPP|nr:Serine/threonine-protein kinase nrc-2 [Porphyridium purpureum]|eukprot:POR6597..scf295_9
MSQHAPPERPDAENLNLNVSDAASAHSDASQSWTSRANVGAHGGVSAGIDQHGERAGALRPMPLSARHASHHALQHEMPGAAAGAGTQSPLSARATRTVNANSGGGVTSASRLGGRSKSGADSASSLMNRGTMLKIQTAGVPSAASSRPPTTPVANVSQQAPVSHYGPLEHEDVVARSAIPVHDDFPLSEDKVDPKSFKKLKLLGKGAVGKVYLVLLKDTQRLYAMKVLTKEEMVRRNRVKRVMTEREILATVNHPFIVSMYASFQTTSRLCFVMEFVEGGEFFRVLQKQPKKRLPESAVRFYAAEVILALEYLHYMGFVYRDLKPENILMRANGHITLTDFDLSKQAQAVSPRVIKRQLSLMDKMKMGPLALRRSESGSKMHIMDIIDSEPIMVESTSFVGTEEYVAPEVVRGSAQTAAVDWWTVGILIYEMLTGTTPFKGRTTQATYNNIVKNEIQFPPDVEISNEAKAVVKKLLRRDADKRLGAESGASELKREKWFANFNFQLIRDQVPPILPRMRDPYDMTQYENQMTNESGSESDDHEQDEELTRQVTASMHKNASAQAYGLNVLDEELTMLKMASLRAQPGTLTPPLFIEAGAAIEPDTRAANSPTAGERVDPHLVHLRNTDRSIGGSRSSKKGQADGSDDPFVDFDFGKAGWHWSKDKAAQDE